MYLFGGEAEFYKVFYFTAIADYLNDSNVVKRHEDYIKCLESKGIIVCRGRFKEKTRHCPRCNADYIGHEEKETDIAISSKLLELLYSNDHQHCDGFCIVTGDTDLIPAIETARRVSPSVDIRFAFPFNRKSDALRVIAPKSFKLKTGHYKAFQFPDPVRLEDGTIISKPVSW